jgi:hypothetical protein
VVREATSRNLCRAGTNLIALVEDEVEGVAALMCNWGAVGVVRGNKAKGHHHLSLKGVAMVGMVKIASYYHVP